MRTKTQSKCGVFRKCFIAYIDILGFEKLIQKASSNSDDSTVFNNVIKAVNYTKNMMESGGSQHHRRNLETGTSFSYQTQIHVFSDHILFFVPVKTNVSWFLRSIVMLHDRILDCGCLIRGAVTIGEMYYDDRWGQFFSNSKEEKEQELFKAERDDLPVAVGQGLKEVYDAERKDAVYPRIFILDKFVKYLKETDNIKMFPLTSPKTDSDDMAITDFMRKDFDGLYHLHILHPKICHKYNSMQVSMTRDGGSISNEFKEISHVDFLGKYREIIIEKLKETNTEDNETIRKKLYWLAHYFNLFCTEAIMPIDF